MDKALLDLPAGVLHQCDIVTLYVGADVHYHTYNLCAKVLPWGPSACLSDNDGIVSEGRCDASVSAMAKFIKKAKDNFVKLTGYTPTFEVVVGYEAGVCGTYLHNELEKRDINCEILAPTTMAVAAGSKKVKNDRLDARMIADCLINNTYKAVHVLNAQDTSVRDYIRMRDAEVDDLKKIKQRITAFIGSRGFIYPSSKSKWTLAHMKWLKEIKCEVDLDQETLDEYLSRLSNQQDRIKRLDARILELAKSEAYVEKVNKMACFKGITALRALSILVEIGDFSRFASASQFASYLGLTPGEQSSGSKRVTTGITKAGNGIVRTELVEAAQSACRGRAGVKSKVLKARQAGQPAAVIEYADRGSHRFVSRYYKLMNCNKRRNVAVVAVAREMACFIWGMMQLHSSAAVEAA